MGSQKFASRQVTTPSSAMARVVLKPTSVGTSTPSMIPSPPGVMGIAASTLAIP